MSTRLGTCQVMFVADDADGLALDLVLTGDGHVEGTSVVPCSPLALVMVPRGNGASRHVASWRLRRWAEADEPCRVAIRLGDDSALIRLSVGTRHVVGELTDLDVMFAETSDHEHQE